MALETDGTGAVYPAVYLRRDGQTSEHLLEADPLLDYEGEAHRAAMTSIVREVLPAA